MSEQQRQASVTLREEGELTESLMDPANQSLADALRITYRLIQIAMIVLVGLYTVSAFQSVQQGESGIRLLFGRITDRDLGPGFRMSWPYPFGELVTVNRSAVKITLDDAFWPFLREDDRGKPFSQLRALPMLQPGRDGALITADKALVHMRWNIEYARSRPSDLIEHVDPRYEEEIVRMAVQRGVIQAVAEVTIDDVLKSTTEISGKARRIAQETLDSMESGIEIVKLDCPEKNPPRYLLEEFQSVNTALTERDQSITEADSEANTILTTTAGLAEPFISAEISRYEEAIRRNDRETADEALDRIDRLMLGESVEIDGQVVEGLVAGEVTQILNEAIQYRDNIANEAFARVEQFRAKRAQYEANPAFTLYREWSDAMLAFTNRDTAETIMLSPGTDSLVLMTDRDPTYREAIEKAIKEAEAARTRQEREEARQNDRFTTDTGLTETPG